MQRSRSIRWRDKPVQYSGPYSANYKFATEPETLHIVRHPPISGDIWP
jgi:hypothetical protein